MSIIKNEQIYMYITKNSTSVFILLNLRRVQKCNLKQSKHVFYHFINFI